MERATEPMADASSRHGARQRGSGRVGRKAGGALDRTEDIRAGGVRVPARQPSSEPAGLGGRHPHEVESAPKVDERAVTEPENLLLASLRSGVEMAEATGDREDEGRSPRSSPRAGKPSTWRRGTVGTACKQEVDACPAR